MQYKIGIITTSRDVFEGFFPTIAEPNLVPTEPCFTPDDQLAIDALRQHGCTVEPVIWGSSIASLHHFDLLIMRSPWDYMDDHKKSAAFLAWVASLEKSNIPLFNSAAMMIWLLDKHYLADLKAQHIIVIPTTYLTAGSQIDLAAYFSEHGKFILKPTVGAGGLGLYFIKDMADATSLQEEFAQKLHHTGYMLQTFIPEIQTNGEWSLVYLGGKYSHGLHKKPACHSILVQAEHGGSLTYTQPPEHIIAFADTVYAAILPAFLQANPTSHTAHEILYMRIDVIDTAKGPVLIECEGVEPELFFRARTESTVKFVRAIDSLMTNLAELKST